MRFVAYAFALVAPILLAGCNGKDRPDPGEKTALVAAPEPIFFTEAECSMITTARSKGGAYFALEASLDGFEEVRLADKSIQKKFVELFWKNTTAMVWTMQVDALAAANPGQRLVVPIFTWGENVDLGSDAIGLPDSRSRQLVTPFMQLDGSIRLRLALNYADKPDVNIAQRLNEIVKFGVMLSGAVPGTHSVATLFTSEVADRIDRNLRSFFADEQKPNFQPTSLTAGERRADLQCRDRQIGVRYRIAHNLLPQKTATIEFKTVFALSKFAPERKDGLPDYRGASLKSIEDQALLVSSPQKVGDTAQIVSERRYVVEYAPTLQPLKSSWDTFVNAQDTNTVSQLCRVLRDTARDSLFLNKADQIAFIAYMYRYRLRKPELQDVVRECLGTDYSILTSLNFADDSLAPTSPGPASKRMESVLAEYGKPRTTGEAAAWTRLSAELQLLLSENQVTFLEFPHDAARPRLLKLDDGKDATGTLVKAGEAAFATLEGILRGRYHCDVSVDRYPGARWYKLNITSGAVGPVTRIDLLEYVPQVTVKSPTECYARFGG